MLFMVHPTLPSNAEQVPQAHPRPTVAELYADPAHAIPIHDKYGGTVIELEEGEYDMYAETGALRKVYEAVGFTFKRLGCKVFAPSPERAGSAAADHDIPVEFTDAHSDTSAAIPAEVFAPIVRRRNHPVGTWDRDYYEHHDIGKAHVLAAAVGGRPGIDLILRTAPNLDDDVGLSDYYDEMNVRINSIVRMMCTKRQLNHTVSRAELSGYISACAEQMAAGGKIDRRQAEAELKAVLLDGFKRLEVQPKIAVGLTESDRAMLGGIALHVD